MIPEGWSEVQVGQLGTRKRPVLKAGPFGSALTKASYVATGYKVYGQQEVLSGDLGAKDYFISEERFRKLSACAVEPGDILITMMGTVGHVLEVPEGARTGVINPRLMRISVDQGRVLPSFLARRLNTTAIRHLLERRAHGGTMPGLNAKAISTLRFLLPPIGEQKAIVETLKTWDCAIETIEALLANARAQKRALIQQLLPQSIAPPKTRLPGFSGEWREIRLGAAFSERVERGEDQLPLLSVTQANGVIPQSEAGRRNISSNDQSNYKTVRAGDIAYNTMRMWQGASALSTLTGKVSPAYTIVTPRKGHDAVFYAYLFKQRKMIHVFERHSQGLVSDTWNLKYPHFAKIRTCVPDIEEQRAIAAALASLDDSTRAYEAQLTALRQEKAALMQQLLTGKRRVKLPESEVA